MYGVETPTISLRDERKETHLAFRFFRPHPWAFLCYGSKFILCLFVVKLSFPLVDTACNIN
jgi:hypothetical protein